MNKSTMLCVVIMTMRIRKHNDHPHRAPVTAKTTNKLHNHQEGTVKDTSVAPLMGISIPKAHNFGPDSVFTFDQLLCAKYALPIYSAPTIK